MLSERLQTTSKVREGMGGATGMSTVAMAITLLGILWLLVALATAYALNMYN